MRKKYDNNQFKGNQNQRFQDHEEQKGNTQQNWKKREQDQEGNPYKNYKQSNQNSSNQKPWHQERPPRMFKGNVLMKGPTMSSPINLKELMSTKSDDQIFQDKEILYQTFQYLEKKLQKDFEEYSTKTVFSLNEIEIEGLDCLKRLTQVFILKHIDLVFEKKIDQRFWEVSKSDIKLKKDINLANTNPDIKKREVLDVFTQYMNFIKNLCLKFYEIYKGYEYEQYELESPKRRILANLLCYYGEYAEMNEKLRRQYGMKKNQNNMLEALTFYYKAVNIYPFEGKFFYLMSTISHYNEDFFNSIYWCVRAYGSVRSYNCQEELQTSLEQNRHIYITYAQNVKPDSIQSQQENFRIFSIYYLRFFAIIFTQIGYEQLEDMKSMFLYLNGYLALLKNEILSQSSRNQIMKDLMLLKSIMEIAIFSIFYTVEGFTHQDKWDHNKLEELLDNESNIKNDAITKKCIQFANKIFTYLIDYVFLYTQNDDVFQEVLYTLYYFLISNSKVARVLFDEKNFYNSFNRLYNLNHKKLSENEKKRDHSFMLVEKKLLPFVQKSDSYLLSFWPVQIFFKRYKGKLEVDASETEEHLQEKLAYSIYLMKLIENYKPSETVDQFLDYDYPQIDLPEEPQKWKGIVVIDGSNVGMRSKDYTAPGETERGVEQEGFSQGIQIAVEFWQKRMYQPVVLLPDYCFSQEEINKRKARAEVKVIPDDVALLQKLKANKLAFGIPNWDHDDSYMIDYAKKKGAFILTNDRYNDHINKEKD